MQNLTIMRILTSLGLVAASWLLAGPSFGQTDPAQPTRKNFEISVQGDNRLTIYENGEFENGEVKRYSKKIVLKGKLALSDDERAITSLGPNGSLVYHLNDQRLEVETNADGQLAFTYSENGKKQPFEPNGRAFMAVMITDLIAYGVGATERAERLFNQGGATAVLQEIARLKKPDSQAKYLKFLASQPGLTDAEWVQICQTAADFVGSDQEQVWLVEQLPERALQNPALVEACLKMASKMESDHAQAKVYGYLLEHGRLAGPALANLLTETARMESDFEMAKVLRLALVQPLDTPELGLVINALDKMESSFEQGRVLKQSLPKIDPASAAAPDLLKAVGRVSSDFERAKVLATLLRHPRWAEWQGEALLQLVGGVSSDFEKAQLLAPLLTEARWTKPHFARLLAQLASINSDFEKSRLLKSLANSQLQNDEQWVALLVATQQLASDFEKASVLVKIGGEMPASAPVREAYRQAARTLGSDSEYGRVMRRVE